MIAVVAVLGVFGVVVEQRVTPAAGAQTAGPGVTQAGTLPDDATKLMGELGFEAQDIQQAAAGTAVARIIKDDGDEAAQAGAVWIDASVDTFVSQFTDIEAFEKSDAMLAIAKTASPPVIGDFAPLDFPDQGIEDLGKCRVGDCAIKIDEAGLNRFLALDSSAADYTSQARQTIREILLGYATSYAQSGPSGLPTLIDKKDPTSVESELAGIITNSPYLAEFAPALTSYLSSMPSERPDGATEFFFWSLANIGLKPITMVDHAIVVPPASGRNGITTIGVVQLYSSHYFHAALELYFLIPAADGSNGFLLVAANRSRSDGLTGFTGRIVRGKAERRGRDSLQGFLETTKQRVEGTGGS